MHMKWVKIYLAYAKMEFTSYGYDVYTSEVDDHGVDFVARNVKNIVNMISRDNLINRNGE